MRSAVIAHLLLAFLPTAYLMKQYLIIIISSSSSSSSSGSTSSSSSLVSSFEDHIIGRDRIIIVVEAHVESSLCERYRVAIHSRHYHSRTLHDTHNHTPHTHIHIHTHTLRTANTTGTFQHTLTFHYNNMFRHHNTEIMITIKSLIERLI